MASGTSKLKAFDVAISEAPGGIRFALSEEGLDWFEDNVETHSRQWSDWRSDERHVTIDAKLADPIIEAIKSAALVVIDET